MSISPLLAPRGLVPAAPVADAASAAQSSIRRERSTASEEAPQAPADREMSGLKELESLASKVGLELRLQALPDSNVTLIKMVEPETGEVVREFPPEGLATALAELRRQAAARLDRKV
jgi:flagellar protein FlaG